MKGRNALLGLAALVAVPLAAFVLARAAPAPAPAAKKDDAPREDRPNVAGEDEEGSEPGGTLVVVGLLGAVAAVAALVGVFVFPPGYVAAALSFGIVSLLGLVVLYVHYRAHHPLDHSTDDAQD